MSTVEVRIAPSDVAAVWLPRGSVIRAVRDSGVREYPDTDLQGWVAARVYGEAFGGAAICTYPFLGLRGIRNGNHKRDRAVWHEAARMIEGGGVAIVGHERQEIYGRQVWVACRVRAVTREPEGTRP